MRSAAAVTCACVCAVLTAPALHGQAPPQWRIVRSATLTVVGDQAPGRLRDIARQLETFRLVVGELISNASRPPALPTIVVVLGPRSKMQPYLPPALATSAAVAGYFRQDRDVNHIVLSLEGFTQAPAVAYHEYTHLLLRETLTSPPLWLEEGIAVYYSSYSAAAGGQDAVVGRPGGEYGNLLRQQWMPVADLITYSGSAASLAHDGSTATAFYGEASMLVHYILTQLPNGGAAINRYLTLLSEGLSPADAFTTAFETTPESMDDTLRAYVARSAFQTHRIPVPAGGAVGDTAPSVTLSSAETRAWQGDIRRSVGWPEGAAEIEAAAVAEPNSPTVRLLLGRSRMAEGNVEEGRRLLTSAADGAPTDFLAQFWAGYWFVQTEAGAASKRPADPGAAALRRTEAYDAVRALRRAVTLRPSSSDAHALLADALIAAGDPLAEAHGAIERAIELAPARLELGLKQAEVLLRLGRRDAARGILAALADAKADPSVARRATAMLRNAR